MNERSVSQVGSGLPGSTPPSPTTGREYEEREESTTTTTTTMEVREADHSPRPLDEQDKQMNSVCIRLVCLFAKRSKILGTITAIHALLFSLHAAQSFVLSPPRSP